MTGMLKASRYQLAQSQPVLLVCNNAYRNFKSLSPNSHTKASL